MRGFGFHSGRRGRRAVSPPVAALLPFAPAAAFGLARIVTGHAGPLLRVRRSADGAEADLSATAGGVLDAAAATAFAAGSALTVPVLYDQGGGARHLTQPTIADQPTLYLGGRVPEIVMAGMTQSLLIPATLAFDRADHALFFVSRQYESAHTTRYLAMGSAPDLLYYQYVSAFTVQAKGATLVNATPPYAAMAPVNLSVVSMIARADGLAIGRDEAVATATTSLGAMTLGGGGTVGGGYAAANLILHALVVAAGAPSEADAARTRAALRTLFGAHPAQTGYMVCYRGDSITNGVGSTRGYPHARLAADLLPADALVYSDGTNGATVAANTRPIWPVPSAAPRVLHLWLGTNNIANGDTGAQTLAWLEAAADYARTTGGFAKVIAGTAMPRSAGLTGAQEAERLALNAGIRGSARFDAVADYAADAVLGNDGASLSDPARSSNVASLFPDGIHPSPAGHARIAGVARATIAALLDPDATHYAIGAAQVADEGQAGTTTLAWTVTRSGQIDAATSIGWAVSGTGADPAGADDFASGVLPSGTLAFASGETSRTIQVAVAGDTAIEADETFLVTLSDPTGVARIDAASATGTIRNDDVAAPVSTAPPQVSGTAQVGQTLSASTGTWVNAPATYAYQWLSGGAAIAGATAAAYTPVAGDVGASLSVVVTAGNAGGSTGATSAATAAVAAAPATGTLLLDGLAAAATGAWSTRRLRTGYAGPALKVRRGSDNAVQDIGFDPAGNLDAAALAAFVGAQKSYLDTFYDQSGQGNHFTQTIAASQPQLTGGTGATTKLNGRTAPSWTGGVFMTNALSAAPAVRTIAAVVSHNNAQAGAILGASASGGRESAFTAAHALTIGRQGSAAFATSTAATAVLTATAARIAYDGAAWEFAIDGAAVGSGSAAQGFAAGTVQLGKGTAFLNGQVGELLLFDGALLGAGDKAAIQASQKGWWGTP